MKKGMKTLALVLSLIMVLGLFAGCEAEKPAETTPPATDAPKAVEMEVLWNVNFTSHYITATHKAPSRSPYDDAGTVYSVSVGKAGGQVNNRVAADQIEKLNGLQFFVAERNADAVITKVKSIAEVGGTSGYGRIMKVEEAGKKITVGTSQNGTETFDLTQTKLYSAWSTTARYVGVEVAQPLPGDQIVIFRNNLGDVVSLWLVSRSGYTYTTNDCPCAACVKARDDAKATAEKDGTTYTAPTVTWNLWTTPDALPTAAGHYFLEGDVTIRAQASIAANAKVVLDLNGHTVIGGTNVRMWSMHNKGCTLDIFDKSEAKTGKMIAWPDEVAKTQGCIIWGRYGTLTLWGGTFDSSTGYCTNNGHSICMDAGTTLNIKEGVKIIGGTAKALIDDEGKLSGGYGGALYANNATINMEGGEIIGGKALSAMSDKSDGRGVGGAVYLAGTTVMNVTGGKITKGTADNGGDCVAVGTKATLNNNGGTIEDIYNIPAA